MNHGTCSMRRRVGCAEAPRVRMLRKPCDSIVSGDYYSTRCIAYSRACLEAVGLPTMPARVLSAERESQMMICSSEAQLNYVFHDTRARTIVIKTKGHSNTGMCTHRATVSTSHGAMWCRSSKTWQRTMTDTCHVSLKMRWCCKHVNQHTTASPTPMYPLFHRSLRDSDWIATQPTMNSLACIAYRQLYVYVRR
jgi:hypothetical protein